MVVPKVLVANRGEIAVRILRSAKELGWCTVALYTAQPSLDTSHATYADEAVKLDDPGQYMIVDTIVGIAARTRCTHVHPGYGFLSESPALANALAQLKPPVTFVGPSSSALRLSGDKMLSRELAATLNIKVAPGTRVASSDDVRSFVEHPGVGYPVMIKALDGGGGRGIRIVGQQSDVDEAFRRCMGESPSGQVFAEKALTGPGWKHIEIQVIGDGTGAVDHLWERDCSIQRRWVAPSALPRSAIQPLVTASLKIAGHLKYQGLGTFEFLVNASTHEWVILEINPRVQVEHTITEEIMGIDLVRAQLLLFSPSSSNTLSSLSLHSPPTPTSTAIQLRLTAENPENGFMLTPGIIKSTELQWPAGRGIRVDTWLSSSPSCPISEWTIGTDFDPLLAKVIVHGRSFEEATQKAQRALREFTLKTGNKVKTNVDVLAGVLEHQDWKDGAIDTLWLEKKINAILSLGKTALGSRNNGVAGLQDILEQQQKPGPTNKGGLMPTAGANILLQPGSLFHLTLSPLSTYSSTSARGSQGSKKHTLTLTSIAHNAFPEKLSGVFQSTLSSTSLAFSLSQSTSAAVGSREGFEFADPNDPQHVAVHLTGKIVEVHPAFKATDGGKKRVKKGETLVVLSVMKMETTVVSPHDGVVERIGKGVRTGVVFGEGMLVCIVKPVEASRL